MSDSVANLNEPKVQSLVLDATPLITQHVSTLQQYAKQFYTTPTVFKEIKDEHARRNLELWGDNLVLRHPKNEFIKKVSDFAKLTGDYAVLSANDIHIIALTYELEVELNHGDWRLRKFPGEKLEFNNKKSKQEVKQDEEPKEIVAETPTTEEPKKKQRRRGGKKQRAKREAALQAELDVEEQEEQQTEDKEINETTKALDDLKIQNQEEEEPLSQTDLSEDYDDSDDDGDWIDQDNLLQEMIKDQGEKIENQSTVSSSTKIKCALSTQDFAVQNVSLQIGLNLMNTLSGLQIKRVRNYMLRCYACFRMIPFPKDGKPKHFCPHCGGQTLLRCAVSVDARTGDVTPHLKANFEWHKRGDRYSLASPLSKASQKRLGKKGFVHNKSNKQKEYNEPILREDQKEYAKAVKDEDWLRRQNEKVLNDWIGGGSADNFISPFAVQGYRSSGVKVGKGRFINSSRGKR
ncbi:hypothetical protein WICANDRAFT_27504 [Wickerhamomyces anomalus NRRL Y-366-8]|uniref:20S-pre-rRNA D-site endonuclease NOB1 n=1 Tax=Wickerhamomyces anomalus (strain ATCC 58044 / CBS 1984 / NCYC 433 / NRRL Y-366-8) TaxID=683960 RepID=A0A1E3P9N5_WICAA|nr:uncharacterized protein WICANDRAFT_27504 [Wickerhamomyces anomalus NRRL Y-366-8]ODQ62123.1 hypothetical protein WICANDRAFT_27504 [Wickerhamomyces anomalus NRRL Y-366-8]